MRTTERPGANPGDPGCPLTADLRLAARLVRRVAARFELGEGDPYAMVPAVTELRAAMNRLRQAARWRGGEEGDQ